jgi:hypothetical protein
MSSALASESRSLLAFSIEATASRYPAGPDHRDLPPSEALFDTVLRGTAFAGTSMLADLYQNDQTDTIRMEAAA